MVLLAILVAVSDLNTMSILEDMGGKLKDKKSSHLRTEGALTLLL
jgi:hypothetical protein